MYLVLAVLFALGGAGAVRLAVTGKGTRGWYPAALCLGLAGCALLLSKGGVWHPKRIVLVVTPGGTPADRDAVSRLREMNAASWKEFAWATLTKGGNDLPRWTAAGPVPNSPAHFPLPAVDAPVDFKTMFRLDALASHAAGSFWPQRPTLVIVLDDRSDTWKQQVAKGRDAADMGLDVIVWDQRTRESQGSLRLDLPDELLLNKPYDRGGSLKVDIADSVPDGQVILKVAGSTVDDKRQDLRFDLARRSPQPVYFGVTTAPPSKPPTEGQGAPHFRYVEAIAKVPVGGGDHELHAGGFVREVNLFVNLLRVGLDDAARPDYWSRLRWREQLDKNDLLPFAAFDHDYLRRHAPVTSADPGIPRLTGLEGVLRSTLPASGWAAGYILENPTLDELQAGHYKEKVSQGASLLLLDPVPAPAATDPAKLAWLPGWPLFDDTHPATFHAEARLYFLAENSRLSALQNAQEDPSVAGALSVNEYQSRVRTGLEERLSPWHPPRPPGDPLAEDDLLAPPRIVDAPSPTAATPAPSPVPAVPMFWLKTPASVAGVPAAPIGETVASSSSSGEELLAALPNGVDLETEAAHIGFRLWLLLTDSGKRDPKSRLPLIDTNEWYEHTDIVLFVTDVRQPDAIHVDPGLPFFKNALAKYQIALTAPKDIKTTEILGRLQTAGVHVHLIAVRSVDTHQKRPSLGPPNDQKLCLPSEFIGGGKTSPVFGAGSRALARTEVAESTTAQTIQGILTQLKLPDATIRIKQYGQVIDWRVQDAAPAPWQYSAVTVPPAHADSIYASVKTGGATGQPLVAARAYGGGQVVVCGYSPFAMDVWVADSFRDDLASRLLANAACTFPRSADSVIKYSRGNLLPNQTPAGSQAGWGVQRLLDFCELTCRRTLADTNGVARRVEFDPATGGLFLHVGLSPGQGISSPPKLRRKIGDGPFAAMEPVRVRSDTQEAIYQLGRQENYHGQMIVVRASPTGAPDVPFATVDTAGLPVVPAATLGGVTAAWALAGGGKFLPLDETQAKESWPLAGASVVAWLLIAVLALLLFFLLGYRWQTIRQTVRSLFSARPDALERAARQTLPVNMEAALAEFGFNPGQPAPTRIPGEPAGWRPYEPSDSLMLARLADLAPYTDLGEDMDLPLVRPRVKLRKSLRAFRAEVWLDLHLRLHLTPRPGDATRADYIRALLLVVAGNVWNQGGSLKVRALQDPACEFGPLTQGQLTEITEWHDGVDRAAFRTAGYDLRLGNELEEGTRLYVVSDFAYLDEKFTGMLQDASAGGLQGLRAVRVADETELATGSLHATVPGFGLYDRSDLDAGELQRESAGIMRELRDGLNGIPNARLIDLDTRQLFDDMLEKLEKEGFFDE